MSRLLTLLALLFATPLLFASVQDHDRRGSPFDGLRWKDGRPEVQVGDDWYRPVSIHGTKVEAILEHCGKRWPGQTEKRFGEDLVEAMVGMGVEVPKEVDLELVRLSDGKSVTLEGVEMSLAKRNAIRNASRGGSRPRRPRPPATLSREEARADVAEFRERLEDQFAYLHTRDVDVGGDLERLAQELGEEVATADLCDRMHRILMRCGDGHARVQSEHLERPYAYPPVLLVEAEGGVVALRPDRSGFLDAERPYVVKIDGRRLAEWVDDLSPWIAAGSPQLVRERALRAMREVVSWRQRLGLPAAETVTYELAARPTARRGKKLEVELGGRRPTYGSWPRGETRRLEGDIGYLRLARMDDDLIPDLRRAMAGFEDTRGLVVDVRGNGGGSRGLLIALAGYLTGEEEGAWVGNVAAYRLSDRFREDHLRARFMVRPEEMPAKSAGREAIDALARTFRPEWDPGQGFSPWHYLVLGPTGEDGEYFYDKPVVVLSDAGCFSATDIFLGALKGRPRVTLMGAASGGGSARSQGFRLAHSGIEVRCASMASFRTDGRLYDGRGVEVDLEVEPAAGDFLEGGGDLVLERAAEHLKGGRSR